MLWREVRDGERLAHQVLGILFIDDVVVDPCSLVKDMFLYSCPCILMDVRRGAGVLVVVHDGSPMKWWRDKVVVEEKLGEKQLANRELGYGNFVIGE